MLQRVNPLVQTFQVAAQRDAPNLHLLIVANPHLDQRRYNKAIVPEIALFRPDLEPHVNVRPRDVLVRVRGEQPELKFISEFNAAYVCSTSQSTVVENNCFVSFY